MTSKPKIQLEILGELNKIERYLKEIDNKFNYIELRYRSNYGSVIINGNRYTFTEHTGKNDDINNRGEGVLIKNVASEVNEPRFSTKEILRIIDDFEEISDLLVDNTNLAKRKTYIDFTIKE